MYMDALDSCKSRTEVDEEGEYEYRGMQEGLLQSLAYVYHIIVRGVPQLY